MSFENIPQDWLYGLIGGLVIGTAAALFLLVNGRIMGASGILGGLVDGTSKTTRGERIAFLGALIGAPAVVLALRGGPVPETHLTTNVPILIAAGLLVGIGTRVANGCTSGHGVCGISRLSPRGIVATLVYLLFGGISLYLFRHVAGVI